MIKRYLLFLLTLIYAVVACGSTTPTPPGAPLPASEPAPITGTSPVPEPDRAPEESLPTEPESGMPQTVSAPTGLRVVYIREGNLWSWTEAGGKAQLTGTGDMSTARLSKDGQLLAFIRGREVWTVRMDGTDARLLATLGDAGGALWFAPNGSLLAVSTGDHIDVIDLNASSSNTVVTYPAVPQGYYPEIVWSPDAFGFKTVIPPQTETGQGELLFIFADGTAASLAKFALVSPTESLPFLSPDGGYVIYVAKLGDGKESLYLMDSSGATRPYGEPAGNVRTLGWMPDSKHFVYSQENPARTFLGDVTGPPSEIVLESYRTVRWVDAGRFLALQDGNLYLGAITGGKTLIDAGVSDFDFEQ
ncbi:MAG: PD40 domain-containing protein [Anaerolineales bacterium]|nr:PD40 domain-containing protein [Anaerolineales bacterium]